MNLYLLTQDETTGYDVYDSVVVSARSESEAVTVHPQGVGHWKSSYPTWATSPRNVEAKYIGKASKDISSNQVICSSFNAG